MRKNPDPAWQGISRVDHKHTHGWLTRIYLNRSRTITKLFSDRKYGGKESALAQARQWHDSYEVAEEDRPNPQPYRYLKTLPKCNTTGRVGVNRTVKRHRNGSTMPCFQVSWSPEPYHPKSKTFYLSQYNSEEEAFQAACAFRAEKEREIDLASKARHASQSNLAPTATAQTEASEPAPTPQPRRKARSKPAAAPEGTREQPAKPQPRRKARSKTA